MTGAESNGEMETKRNAVSFRGEINSFPFPSIFLSLPDAVSFLPRTFPSISPRSLTHSLQSTHTCFVRFFSPTFDDLVTSRSPQNWMESRDDNNASWVTQAMDILMQNHDQKPCNRESNSAELSA